MSPKDGAKGLVRQARKAIRPGAGPEPAAPASRVAEPCLACGEETAIGSVFYSDRYAVTWDGASTYLCSLCSARVRSSRAGRRMTDEEIREAVRNGSVAAVAWSGGI